MLKYSIRETMKACSSDSPPMPNILKGIIQKQLRLSADTLSAMLYDTPTMYDTRINSPEREKYVGVCSSMLGAFTRDELVRAHSVLSRIILELESRSLDEWEKYKREYGSVKEARNEVPCFVDPEIHDKSNRPSCRSGDIQKGGRKK